MLMAARKKKSGSRKSAAKKAAKTRKSRVAPKKAAKAPKRRVAAKPNRRVAAKKVVRAAKKRVAAKKPVAAPRTVMAPPAQAPALAPVTELDNRIAIVRANLRELVEQAASSAGAANEELLSQRIAEQEAKLASLRKQREELAPDE
jgi:hypothetical protein